MRLVITGMGIVSPLGNGVPAFWDALCRGESGIRPLARLDTSGFTYTRGGEVRDIPPAPDLPLPPGTDLATRFMLAAAAEAAAQARLQDVQPPAIGIVLGTNFGGATCAEQLMGFTTGRLPAPDADVLAGYSFQQGADHLARLVRATGPRTVLSLSCSSGTAAIVQAASLIRQGHAQAVLTGGYDALSRFAWAGLSALRTMAKETIRPFDKRRDGTLFSEGAGILVLESLDHALERGATPLAEFLGSGLNNNAFHMTAPDKQGDGMAGAMQAALDEAGLAPDRVDHVNAHGTGTPYNDAIETLAIKTVFGAHAYRMPVTSIKSMTGHLMGAAGAAEAIATVLTIRNGCIPPTINLEVPDPACDLDYVPQTARHHPVRIALSNSAGIGGNNASILLAAYEAEPGQPRPGPAPDHSPLIPKGDAMNQRVVITGIGPVSAIGVGREAFATALTAGKNGFIREPLTATSAESAWTAPIRDFHVEEFLESQKAYLDRSSQFAFAAAALALEDAGLTPSPDMGIILGTAYGSMETMLAFYDGVLEKGPRFAKPFLFPHAYANTAISLLAIEYGLKGFHLCLASGFTAGAAALAEAYAQIRTGRSTVILAGGCDALSPALLQGCRLAGWLANGSDTVPDPHSTGGIIPGEGAAILVIEAREHALARGAIPLAEITDIAWSGCPSDDSCGRPLPDNPPGSGIRQLLGETFGADGALQACAASITRQGGLIPCVRIVSQDPGGSRVMLTLQKPQPGIPE